MEKYQKDNVSQYNPEQNFMKKAQATSEQLKKDI